MRSGRIGHGVCRIGWRRLIADRRLPRALILTAGLGTRLRPLTYVRAKAAVPINGTPLVERVLRWLADAGISDVVLNLHHRPQSITSIVGDGEILLRVLQELGLHVWFRYEKYREEFAYEDVIVAIDETPVGIFVEIEGSEPGIAAMADALGRLQSDYIQDSYRGLFLKHREECGLVGSDMVFAESDGGV